MSLTEEYNRQSTWRDWMPYIESLPIEQNHILLDLGCSVGTVTKLLAQKAYHVTGIDINRELLQEAQSINLSENIDYKFGDLKKVCNRHQPKVDGIWTSFVAAYFPDFTPILNSWLHLLKPGGWIAIVEMSDLFGHTPMSHSTRNVFREYYHHARANNTYDFEMGSKLETFMVDCGLSIIHEENRYDRELAFEGPAEPQIIEAWAMRFDRMFAFKDHVGEKKFVEIKTEFLDCLSDESHKSATVVTYIIGRKLLRTPSTGARL